MRIGVVSYDYAPSIGGLGIVVQNLVTALRTTHTDDQFFVLSPQDHADDFVHPLTTWWKRGKGSCPLFSILFNLQCMKICHKWNLNLLHLHCGSGGVFLLRKPNVPVLATAHHTYAQEVRILQTNTFLQKTWKRFMSLLEKRTYQLATAITCVSHDTADSLIHDYGIEASKIQIIENGIVPLHIPTSKITKESYSILFVGRLEERKGIRLLLEAFNLLRQRIPVARLTLLGRNMIGNKLQVLVDEHTLDDYVSVLGFTTEEVRVREMMSASVIAVPSILEGFGLIAAEAMFIGTCVVALPCPGLRSILKDRQTAILSKDCTSATSLAEALYEGLSNSVLRTQIEHSAKVESALRFNHSDRTNDYYLLIKKLGEFNGVRSL